MTLAINTVADLGFVIGTTDAGMRETCKPFHRTYIKADAAEQAQMRYDFKVNYVRGLLKVPHAKAEAIVDAGKRTGVEKHDSAVNSAGAMCTKWLVNGGVTKASAAQTAEVKISRAQMQAIKACKALGVTATMFKSVK
jgi:predicted TIM-barrel enzyme